MSLRVHPRLLIAQTKQAICKTFQDSSSYVWNRMEEAHKHNMQFGEETITETLLLEIKKAHPQDIVIQQYSKADEATHGGDWAWWFQGKNCFLGLRVQAKRLDVGKLQYSHLSYKTKKVHQAKILVESSSKSHLFPMYCFYNYWDKYTVNPSTFHCGTFLPQPQSLGCMLADAHQIYSNVVKKNTNKLADVFPHSFPLVCLVCCSAIQPDVDHIDSLAHHVKAVLDSRITETYAATDSKFLLELPKIIKTPPQYVSAIMDNAGSVKMPKNLAGVVVFKNSLLQNPGLAPL